MAQQSYWFVDEIQSEFFPPLRKEPCERCSCSEDHRELMGSAATQCGSCGHPVACS